jgi:hypothetical protein
MQSEHIAIIKEALEHYKVDTAWAIDDPSLIDQALIALDELDAAPVAQPVDVPDEVVDIIKVWRNLVVWRAQELKGQSPITAKHYLMEVEVIDEWLNERNAWDARPQAQEASDE